MHCFGEQAKEFYCKVVLLDDTELTVEVKDNVKGEFILNQVFQHLNLLEKDYFGLRYLDHTNQTQWLDPSKSVKSQIKGPPPYTVYFGVKFYAADPCNLREEITRYQFFLQVKRDIFQGRLPVTFDQAAELCAFAVQSEMGDYDPRRHVAGYVSEFRFVPNQTEDLEERIMRVHRSLAGMTPSSAERRYLDTIKWLDMFGVDMHPVKGDGNVEYFLGLTPTGVVVYKNKSKVGNYFWPRIVKVTFKAKTFMIRVRDKNNVENIYAFEAPTKQACKHLWKCCVEHHAFFRLSHITDPTGAFLNFGSKYRYSGRTEKQAQNDQSLRQEPKVLRAPSRRQQRRSGSDPLINTAGQSSNGFDIQESQPVKLQSTPEPVRTPSKSSNLGGQDSPHSGRSAPWENDDTASGGLYTKGRDSPYSVQSEKLKFPRRAPSTGSEGSEQNKRHRHHRSRRDSENNESSSRRRRRRSKDKESSGTNKSNSDISESSTGRRRHHYHRRHSSREEMVSSEAQWKEIQRRQRDGEVQGPQDALVKDLKQNGSMRSLRSENSNHSKNERRRRRRSRSPGKKPPEELRQHFVYDLVDPAPLTEEQRKDIPFVSVETKAQPYRLKYSPRHRRKSPHRRSTGDGLDPPANQPRPGPRSVDSSVYNVPIPPTKENRHSNPSLQTFNDAQQQSKSEDLVFPSPSVYKQPDYTNPPTVRTKGNQKLMHLREDSGIGNDQEYHHMRNQDGQRKSIGTKSFDRNTRTQLPIDTRPGATFYEGEKTDRNTRAVSLPPITSKPNFNTQSSVSGASSGPPTPSIRGGQAQRWDNPQQFNSSMNSTINSEILRQVIKSPSRNRDLCTEL